MPGCGPGQLPAMLVRSGRGVCDRRTGVEQLRGRVTGALSHVLSGES
jgi:hypothetical protein